MKATLRGAGMPAGAVACAPGTLPPRRSAREGVRLRLADRAGRVIGSEVLFPTLQHPGRDDHGLDGGTDEGVIV